MRIGHGFDAHRLEAHRPLVLGGVSIPYDRGLAAHSDGDAVIHALCDALLGAAGLPDIGSQFPDSSAEFKDVDSRVLLRRVADLLAQKGLRVANADITILAEAPRLAPFLSQMCANLAADLQTDAAAVNIKATTTEKMGYIGRGEGIAAHAVVLIDART
ncbi:MAG: 2-C-methyl-D-erythritol 2,4-cyclodiphosphate synthase [Gammaproteobacteria bacterium]|nr:2-C-methyl-D-erythritol 2,4-cyclodiphosphate synthase [Gammaproteobacteria bacterium]